MKTVAIAQARMGSTRFPGKVMLPLGRKPMLQWTLDALCQTRFVNEVILATSIDPRDDVIADHRSKLQLATFRGSEEDVLDRLYQAAKHAKADIVLRITCDCPFIDPQIVDEVIKLREMTNADYTSNVHPPSYPDGLDVECFTFAALEEAWTRATRNTDRDTVTQYIVRNASRFKSANLHCPLPGLDRERWVVDTEDDFKLAEEIIIRLGGREPPSYMDILKILDANPELRRFNEKWTRNERFYAHLAKETDAPRTFKRSEQLHKLALKTIPFGAQTFSKSHLQFPAGKAPLYCTHGQGAWLYDVDGNDYVDLVSAILPIILGYRDPDVDQAIRNQLDRGISFSLATELESELSELLCRHIPCAEMVKLGKSGTDVTTAAVRVARAHTNRPYVLYTGYHGWADWSMALTDRSLGIVEEVKHCSFRLRYGEQDERPFIFNRAAAIVVEPNDNPEYLKWLRRMCNQYGIVLVFDEIITGFRYGLGGAQEHYGVTPDLATFGKAMANGMPISAVVGLEKIMKRFAPPNNVFYSGTMFGETLSIAAAIATINKIERENVPLKLYERGKFLAVEVQKLIDTFRLNDLIQINGHPSRKLLTFQNDKIRTFFIAEMAKNGVLIINSHNLNLSHGPPEMDRIIRAYSLTLLSLQEAIIGGTLDKAIEGSIVTAAPLRATA